ncbi:Protein FAR1-RELATED SEQUENCE 5 [Bienertia sinuspersici]
MKFDSLEKGVTFYRNYAKVCGFTTRMSSVKKRSSDGVVLFKIYCVCSKEGFKETPKVAPKSNRNRAVTRVGCKLELHLGFVRRVAIWYLLFMKVIHMFYLLQH